jgi:hypothetical protein
MLLIPLLLGSAGTIGRDSPWPLIAGAIVRVVLMQSANVATLRS